MDKFLENALKSSPYLRGVINSYPELKNWLLDEGNIFKSKTKKDFKKDLSEFLQLTNISEFSKKLRFIKKREYLRLWARDINSLSKLEDTMRELSYLAESLLEAAFLFSEREIKEKYKIENIPFVIIGVGKLGGRELNFYSDIDLFYLYDDSFEKAPLYNELSLMINKILGEFVEGDILFKLDFSLRPGGKEGTLVQSFKSAEIYYESWGNNLDRLALLKARPIAINENLGKKFLLNLEPFIYKRYLDYESLKEIRKIKEKINAEAEKVETFNIKLGKGGIREIEFFVYGLELIYAGKKPSLREKNTLCALKKLYYEGLIDQNEAERLSHIYKFLRKLEHLLQMRFYRQTHTLPKDKGELETLAKFMGFKSLDKFLITLRKNTSFVNAIFKDFLKDKKEKTKIFLEISEEKLKTLGFKNPKTALEILSNLKNPYETPYFSSSSKEEVEEFFEKLLDQTKYIPDPDQSLIFLERFIRKIGPRTTFYSILNENPDVLKFLLTFFSISPFLSSFFVQYPELIDTLLLATYENITKEKDKLEKEVEERLKNKDIEQKITELRLFKNEEILRIAFYDIGGVLPLNKVSKQITSLAEVSLNKALDIAYEILKEKYGVLSKKFSIFGLGSLAGWEMGYLSDLDIIFIYEGGINLHEYFVKLAQRIISILSMPNVAGIGWSIDTRLRPSGTFGPLVVSKDAFRIYHEEKSWFWEKQALVKLRFICGDEILGEEIEKLSEKFAFSLETKDLAYKINEMRLKIEKEKGKKINIKFGKGGLCDIEFVSQYLQLKNKVKSKNTYQTICDLEKRGFLKKEDAYNLKIGYLFLKGLDHRINLIFNKNSGDFSLEESDLIKIAKFWGFKKPPFKIREDNIVSLYYNFTEDIREIYNKILK